jgi:hypothetical protein
MTLTFKDCSAARRTQDLNDLALLACIVAVAGVIAWLTG